MIGAANELYWDNFWGLCFSNHRDIPYTGCQTGGMVWHWPWVAFLVLGIVCLYLSFRTTDGVVSMWWGYNSFINLWTIKEMFDQHKRAGYK